ncbi:MAG: hypothetical protein QOD98_1046 [Nocardioidaceae bacterium]|nr:hypothetical protein [Nocardioidaceae bacterium]
MTNPNRPTIIRTQAELTEAWRHLIRPLGFHRRSVWLLLIDGDDRPTPVMTEVTDLPDAPEAEATDGFGHLLSDLLQQLDPAGRWALLLSRPGAHATDEMDRAWAGALYDTVRSRGIRHDTIHLATDDEIIPVPLDDVTSYLRAS